MIISATEFKAKCLSLMDLVESSHQEITITKHGKPIAKLIPSNLEEVKTPFGFLKGKVQIHGDITEKLGIEWDFESK